MQSSGFVYVEVGGYECLLRMSRDQFHALMSGARHGQICNTPTH